MTQEFSNPMLTPPTPLPLTKAIAALQGVRGMVWSRESLQLAERIAAVLAHGGQAYVPEASLARLAATTTHTTPAVEPDVTLLVGMAAVYGLAAGVVTRANLAGMAVMVERNATPPGLVVTAAEITLRQGVAA